MKIEVAKNTKRNIIVGVLNKTVLVILPFVVRSVIVNVLGSQYLGLNSLFTSILSVLALSEMGFGVAMVYHMYKPIAEDDQETINALLNLYKKVYRIIGVCILVIGAVLIPFLPNLINGGHPEDVNLAMVYSVELVNTALTYFLFGYKQSLLIAYQRDDVKSLINLVTQIGLQGSQILFLFLTHNYYMYVLCMPVFTIVNNLWIGFMTKKMYPEARCEGKLEKSVIANIKKLVAGSFIQKACATTRNSLDSICVSAFLGLTLTAVYNNYFGILNAVRMVVYIAIDSLAGGIGNHVATRSSEENYQELKKTDFLYMLISGWCSIALLCLFQPFMRLWMGEELMLPISSVILFAFYFYTTKIGDIKSNYTTARGLWWKMKFRSIAETLVNLALNIVLGLMFGINGIIIATAISLISCNFFWGATILFDDYFDRKKLKDYFLYHIKYLLITAALGAVTFFVCQLLTVQNGVLDLVVKLAVCIVLPTALYLLIYGRTAVFRESVKILNLKKLRRKSK